MSVRLAGLLVPGVVTAGVIASELQVVALEDVDGDRVTVALKGPGTIQVLPGGSGLGRAPVETIRLTATSEGSRLTVSVEQGTGSLGDGRLTIGSIEADGPVGALELPQAVINGRGVVVDGSLALFAAAALEGGADLSIGAAGPVGPELRLGRAHGTPDDAVVISVAGDLGRLVVGSAVHVKVLVPGAVRALNVQGASRDAVVIAGGGAECLQFDGEAEGLRVSAGGQVKRVSIERDMRASIIASAGDLDEFSVGGDMLDSLALAGVSLGGSFDLVRAACRPAVIRSAAVGGAMVDAIIAAGGDPGADGLFQDGEVLPGGRIDVLEVGGLIMGLSSPHPNPGIYAASIGRQVIAGRNVQKGSASEVTRGSAVIDPLPDPADALTPDRIKSIVERAVRRATQLAVNATIAVVDREGNVLAVARMADPAFLPAVTTVDIQAGGRGGLEAADGLVPASLIAVTKAGTGAFLSSSKGNAFTTRTAGFIVQTHFPPGIFFRAGGPLFGVQLSNLPTSDVNRLPLGLSADPGGLPLYRPGELLGGIGVEADGLYTVDPTRKGGTPTIEERIALAGQIGSAPAPQIRADRILIDGVRLDYANAQPPARSSLGTVTDYDTLVAAGLLVELLAPRASPTGATGRASIFHQRSLGAFPGEVPDASQAPGPSPDPDVPGAPGALGLDFFDEGTGAFAFQAGDLNGAEQLTASDVSDILLQAHELNHRLRAMIRRDRPQRSQVTVTVVDHNGNILGAFRTPDAPMFGYDVSVQKARTAAFFSRPDAGAELRALDTEVDVVALHPPLGLVDSTVADPYARHADAANAIGLMLNGNVALSDRAIGFLSRPNLPDGIDHAGPGPFTARSPDRFSPFNTGLQTTLLLPELVEFLLEFSAVMSVDESVALARFTNAVIGDGGGVVPLDSNAGDAGPGDFNPGGGLPQQSMANGMQIFAGSVPLYKNGVLVGGVGVSGDGIEQDDYVAFAGAKGFQAFGAGVKRADSVIVAGAIRLPYVKLPRSPFVGQ